MLHIYKLLTYAYKTAHELGCVAIGCRSVLNHAHTDQSRRGNVKASYRMLHSYKVPNLPNVTLPLLFTHFIVTLCASCGAVYCNRSCLFVCVCVCGYVTTITQNCVHRSSPNWVCR